MFYTFHVNHLQLKENRNFTMVNRISINLIHQAILLYNSPRDKWEDKTESISTMYEAYYCGNRTGSDVCYGCGSGN